MCACAPEAARRTEYSEYEPKRLSLTMAKSLLDTGGADGEDEDPYFTRMRYRRGLWKSAMLRLIKNLRIGRPVLKLWLERPIAACWFAVGPRKHAGGTVLLESLEKSFKDLVGLTTIDAPSLDKSKREHEQTLLKNSWEALKPLITHELVSIVQATDDVFVYTSPEGRTDADPLVYLYSRSGIDAQSFAMVSDKILYKKDDREWHRLVKSRLDEILGIYRNHERLEFRNLAVELINFTGDLINEESSVLTGNDLYKRQRKFRIDASINVEDLPVSFVEIIGFLADLWVRRAKLREHARSSNLKFPKIQDPDGDNIRRLWAQVCAWCRLGIDLSANLHPRHLQAESRLRVRFSTLYGLALGRLERFFEAHRRLNEAGGILSKLKVVTDDPPLAIQKLTRAEVHILEACLMGQISVHLTEQRECWGEKHTKGDRWKCCRDTFVNRDSQNTDASPREQKKRLMEGKAREDWCDLYLEQSAENDVTEGKGDPVDRLLRLHIAKLDEAWLTLEDAERALSGKSQASRWWSRLRALQLRVLAEQQFLDPSWPNRENSILDNKRRERDEILHLRTVSLRRQRGHADFVRDLFKQTLSVVSDDLYRFTRALDYLLPAHRHATNADKLLQDSNSNLTTARCSHRVEIKKLLRDVKTNWYPKSFAAFEAKSSPEVPDDLISIYCSRVLRAYGEDGLSESFKAEAEA
jgi:hypothetical protein